MSNIGMIKVAAATPKIKVADIDYNKNQILDLVAEADRNGAGFIVLPELTLTGYTAGDLFFSPLLYEKQIEALSEIALATKDSKIVTILGFYVQINNYLYNCACLIQGGKIKGIVPKFFIPNSGEFHEKRWFSSGFSATLSTDLRVSRDDSPHGTISLCGQDIPFGNIVFKDASSDIAVAIEVCRDLWTAISPSSFLSANGAHIVFNTSASPDTAGKFALRRSLVVEQSRKNVGAYVYSSCGTGESSSDVIFAGHRLIAECGTLLAEGERFYQDSALTYQEIDVAKIKNERSKLKNFDDVLQTYAKDFKYREISLSPLRTVCDSDILIRKYNKNPFLPADTKAAFDYLSDAFAIQATGLAKRMQHIGLKKSILGISGGLDSTLALLVACEAHRMLGLPNSNIIAVTMPGFGTTDHTHANALSMMKLLGVDMREISIKNAVLLHFDDIGHDRDVHDLTYENSQARERTQILMDLAGKENALMIGTGDLSEIALGWCTYNGDHMAMYGVNGGVPKTLIPHILTHIIDVRYHDDLPLRATIQSVIDTPISPELLPPSEAGDIAQKTEDKVGPYVLHDFFIYHTLTSFMSPAKLFFIAEQVFAKDFDKATIKKWLRTFYSRFFSQQFKRNCSVDCPQVTDVSLSPRGGFYLASDAMSTIWLAEVDSL